MESIGTNNDAVPVRKTGFREIDLDDRILAQRTSQDRAELAGHRIFLRKQTEFALHFDIGVISGQLLDLAVTNEVSAAIANMTNENFFVTENACGQRRSHAALLGFHAEIVDVEVGLFEDLLENLIGFIAGRRSLEGV